MTMLDERPASARRAMIDCQLRVSGVNDPAVLAAMDAVAREEFVPASIKANAYIDRAVPLGEGHFLPAPLVQGRMLVEAVVQPGEKVLVVSACGYLGALVTAMGALATTISPATAATRKQGGPYDLILIDGAVEQLPSSIAAMLADNGRVVTGLNERGVTRLSTGRKAAGTVTLLPLADIGMPVLAEFAAPNRWSF
ncbi:MAG: protein-L-isoaspartate O-methyltransferase [Novosphingobium sp.]